MKALVWHTAASPALSIWYLFVLFVLSLACPLLLRGRPERLPWLAVLGLALYAAPLPAYVYLDHVGRYAVFFVAGALAGAHDGAWSAFIDRRWQVLLGLLLAGCVAIAMFGAGWPPAAMLLPMGLLSMPALHGLVRHAPAAAPLLLRLGRYSFAIYLFNTLCIGLAKGLLLHLASWNGTHFLAFAAALMAAGVLGPIALKRFAVPQGGRLDRLTD